MMTEFSLLGELSLKGIILSKIVPNLQDLCSSLENKKLSDPALTAMELSRSRPRKVVTTTLK